MRHHLQKTCPILLRPGKAGPDVLAFSHPLAGHQIVKGTVERSEAPVRAAIRELWEESGIRLTRPMRPLGAARIRRGTAADPPIWHLFAATVTGLPEHWNHHCADDGGLTFSFFWQPLSLPLRPKHSAFNDALHAARAALAGRIPPAQYAVFRPTAPE